MKTVIAIDGPAASGKSTIARKMACELGFGLVNSGGFYRAVTWWLLRMAGPDCTEAEAERLLAAARLESEFRSHEAVITVDGLDAWPHLREADVNRHVSEFSQFACVRSRLNSEFRKLAEQQPCVVEGRDIGTCVFPETPHKFYLDASPEERQKRRLAEGLVDEIQQRDRLDSGRQLAPLMAARDAHVIDTTKLGIEEATALICSLLPQELFQTHRDNRV